MKTLSAYDEETHAVNRIQTIARGRLARKRTRERRNVKLGISWTNNYEDLHVKKGRKYWMLRLDLLLKVVTL